MTKVKRLLLLGMVVGMAANVLAVPPHAPYSGTVSADGTPVPEASVLVEITSLVLDEFPQSLLFCPRDLGTGMGTFPVEGQESSGGFSEVVLRILREGVPYGTEQVVSLDYSGGPAEFSFTAQIPAELAEFEAELVLRNSEGTEFLAQRAEEIVAGDVFVVQGQSNADAAAYNGTANGYQSPFVRTFGQNSDNAATTVAAEDWLLAQGDGSMNKPAGIGQWALTMANELTGESGVPIAILNGAHPGQAISFFQRDDADTENLATNYGRLLHRALKGGLTDVVRGFFFYQGESDFDNAAVHDVGFVALYEDWKDDFPNAERFYVFQVREGCAVGRFNVALRDVQRRFQDRFADITSNSVNGLDGHDGCHYSFAGGYELMGLRIAAMVSRDYYGAVDDPNIAPPNPAFAEFIGGNSDRIRIHLRRPSANLVFEAGAETDFALVGSSATVVYGSIVAGAIELQLSGSAVGATAVEYGGHIGAGPWVITSAGAALFSFSESLVDSGPVPRLVSFAAGAAAGVIDYVNHTVTLGVPIGTDLSTLAPTVTISADATVSPLSGAAGDFTNPVIYTVTAQDSSTQDYTVTVTEVAANTEKEIVFFSVGANAGVIDNGNHTVSVSVADGTDLSNLTPTVLVSASATVSPNSGATVDFTNPVTYTVTAQDSSTQDYTVTVLIRAPSISLNLATTLAPTDVAGAAAYRRQNWNNVTDGGGVVTGNGSAGSHNGLKDDSGTLVTGMTMTWTGTFVSNAGSSGGTAGDTIMMQYALLAAGQGSSATLDITNIPYAKYEIVVYTHSNYPDRGAEVSVTGSPDTYVHLPSAAGFSGTYTQVTSTDAFNPGVGNYSVHKGLTASSATITWTPLSELGLKNEGRVTGIQVVEVASLSAHAD